MYSSIWDHLTVNISDNAKAICNYCKVEISRGGKNPKTLETTNLLKHLQLNHISQYSSLETAEQAREMDNKDKSSSDVVKTLNNYVQQVTAFRINHPTERKIT